eukprot:8353036-Prorocentrum_lima.AAC.1
MVWRMSCPGSFHGIPTCAFLSPPGSSRTCVACPPVQRHRSQQVRFAQRQVGCVCCVCSRAGLPFLECGEAG